MAQSVVVTEAVVEPMPSSSLKEELISSSPAKEDLFSSPTPPPNSLASPYSRHPLLEDLHAISLSGEDWGGDGKRRGSSSSTSWVQFGGEEEDLVQKSTSDRLDQNNILQNAIPCLIFQHM